MSNIETKKQFGLLGRSLSHSFSKSYFTQKFSELALTDCAYDNFEIESIEFFETLCNTLEFSGLNVTIPFKESIIPFLDELSDEAKVIGAVNTIVFHNSKKIGHNTDAFGFQQMIKPFLLNTHERALVLGNGGASKAVKYVLKNIGLEVLIAARNPKEGQFHLDDVNAMMVKHCGIIVNTTPIGTAPNIEESPTIPFSSLHEGHLVVDLIYNPEITSFLAAAKQQWATTLNGLTMLHQQAEKSWQLWNQKE